MLKKLGDHVKSNMLIDTENFRSILQLDLIEKSKKNVIETIKILEKRDDVLYVGPDYAMQFFGDPDPMPTYYADQWAIKNIKLPQAWDITKGSGSVVVGVTDSGIDGNHPDLTNQIERSLCGDFTVGNSYPVTPTDTNGHGTHVAGIIGAGRNSGITGVTGVNQNVRLASLKINNADAGGPAKNAPAYVSSTVRAVAFATQKNIKIINHSAGYLLSHPNLPANTDHNALYTIISSYPGLFICASGNDNKNTDNNPVYPASFTLPNILSVGATTSSDTRASYSNYGVNSVDIFAPGGEDPRTNTSYGILSTFPTNLSSNVGLTGYYSEIGTSMAAPHVAGVAALILSANSSLNTSQLKTAIIDGADKIPSLSNSCVSGGRLNANHSIQLARGISAHMDFTQGRYLVSSDIPKEIYMKFTSGNRVFQTLGNADTKLEIYTQYGTTPIYSDDNSGINNNASISFYPSLNVIYRIKVIVKSGSNVQVDLIIVNSLLPQTQSLSNFGLSNLSGNNKIGFYHITSQTSGLFKFKTNNFYNDLEMIVLDASNGNVLGSGNEPDINISSNQHFFLIVLPNDPHQSYSMKITKITSTAIVSSGVVNGYGVNATWVLYSNSEATVSGYFDIASMYHTYDSSIGCYGLSIELPFSFTGITIIDTDDWSTMCFHDFYNNKHYLFVANPFESYIYLEVKLTGASAGGGGNLTVVSSGTICDTGCIEYGYWTRYSNNTAIITGYFNSEYHNYYSSQYGYVYAIYLPFTFTWLEVSYYGSSFPLMFYKEDNYLILKCCDYFYLELKLSGVS